MALFPGAGGDGNNVPLLFFRSQVESDGYQPDFYSGLFGDPDQANAGYQQRAFGSDQHVAEHAQAGQMDRRYLRRRSLDGQFDEGAGSSAVRAGITRTAVRLHFWSEPNDLASRIKRRRGRPRRG